MPSTRFLIVCEPRTGSNWLCDLLRSHPRVLCHHEVFHPDALFYDLGHRDGQLAHLGTTQDRDRDPRRFLQQLWREDFGREVVGFKMLNGQAPGVLAELLGDSGVKKVLLRRRSRVRACISLLRARETGSWARTPYDGVSVHVAAHELLDFTRRYEAFYASLRSATRAQPAIETVYEDLQSEPREVERLLHFLGVEAAGVQLRSQLPRQSHDSLREAIRNFDELALELRGTPLGAELEEEPSAESASNSAS
jgi:hypothetical protein